MSIQDFSTAKSSARRRGRPTGQTPQGVEAKRRLYETAIKLFARQGYEETTMRDIAEEAGVSAGLLYKYFASKRAVVLALYDLLSAEYAERARQMPAGRWSERSLFATRTTFEVLQPHRSTLAALLPVLVGNTEENLFSPSTAFSRKRVQDVFYEAVLRSSDVPSQEIVAPLARLLYLWHLGVILWWLLDKSQQQRATKGLLDLFGRVFVAARLALRLPKMSGFIVAGDALFCDALFGDDVQLNGT